MLKLVLSARGGDRWRAVFDDYVAGGGLRRRGYCRDRKTALSLQESESAEIRLRYEQVFITTKITEKMD